jgi:endonuclease YncB( thermonuclease family)
MLRFLITILVMALMVARANAFEVGNTISGSARAIDGDTLEISGVRIRLNSVAAPERNELGGAEATTAMKKLTSGKTVRWSLTGKKTYKREVGTCWMQYPTIHRRARLNRRILHCPPKGRPPNPLRLVLFNSS